MTFTKTIETPSLLSYVKRVTCDAALAVINLITTNFNLVLATDSNYNFDEFVLLIAGCFTKQVAIRPYSGLT
jgi:hypothetical protein